MQYELLMTMLVRSPEGILVGDGGELTEAEVRKAEDGIVFHQTYFSKFRDVSFILGPAQLTIPVISPRIQLTVIRKKQMSQPNSGCNEFVSTWQDQWSWLLNEFSLLAPRASVAI
jgi:hypothetical protein